MNIYWVIHYFEEGGQNENFHLRFRAKLQITIFPFDIFIFKSLYGLVP